MGPAETYIKFITHVEMLVDYGLGKMEDRHLSDEGLTDSAHKVIERLRSPSAQVVIANAFAQLEPEIEAALVGELEFITNNIQVDYNENEPNPRYRELHENDGDAEAHAHELASAAKVGKDSLESILKKWLPDWVRNRLKILNEILSIVFKL